MYRGSPPVPTSSPGAPLKTCKILTCCSVFNGHVSDCLPMSLLIQSLSWLPSTALAGLTSNRLSVSTPISDANPAGGIVLFADADLPLAILLSPKLSGPTGVLAQYQRSW